MYYKNKQYLEKMCQYAVLKNYKLRPLLTRVRYFNVDQLFLLIFDLSLSQFFCLLGLKRVIQNREKNGNLIVPEYDNHTIKNIESISNVLEKTQRH